ncbi:ribonuclease HII [Haloimpatiens massiliensis]|uniref:ribonuclease HII n=1 Tax=Haloimpatiens massiliensis TaxID=1658110 RepID=UPI000C83D35D|nr:ribonuclease HII [Haloimpatiens massiliensis]
MSLNISPTDLGHKNVKEIKVLVKYIEENFINIKEEDFLNLTKCLLDDGRKSVNKLAISLLKYRENMEKEIKRVTSMYNFDKVYSKDGYVIGTDEVGRGPLAGPIVAAAVVLDLNGMDTKEMILGLNDSKKLTAKKREELSKIIKKKALAYKICLINNNEIDTKGIGWCNNQVLLEAAEGIDLKPSIVLSDGYKIKGVSLPNKAVVKGDSKSASIACASILAKVYRDNIMIEYANSYEGYGFHKNMGYGTEEHIKAIKSKGITSIHRMSFLKNI